MKVEMVDYTEYPEEKIANYAAICYNSDTAEEANARRIQRLMNVKHLATLRFAYATFLVEGVSRACTHQLVRHPHLSYLQESQRYVNQKDSRVTVPPRFSQKQRDFLFKFHEYSSRAYDILIDMGAKKEDARYLLLEGSQSRMYITGNFQAWYDFLENRTGPTAQWEIQRVAVSIQEQLMKIAPNVFKHVGE
jgi:thymidylate synthase (FAD)